MIISINRLDEKKNAIMIIHQDITDTIGQTASCVIHLDHLKEILGNPKNINPQTHHNNIETFKKATLFSFQQYLGTRKLYNHDIIQIENKLVKLEADFKDILSLVGEPSKDQVILLTGILSNIQKLIVGQIKDNPTHYLHLRQNFPDSFK